MFTLNCKGRLVVLERPVVMGIINLTPDSFFSGSRAADGDGVLRTAEKMISDGALFLDVGGQSTRPGSKRISEDEERSRVIPAIELLHQNFPGQLISIDTYYGAVARDAVAAGASLVNDISGGSMDSTMISTVAAMDVPYVLMHMQGVPETMQQAPDYKNLGLEIFDFFIHKLAAVRAAGINDVILDPGFGFGKTIAQSFRLLDLLPLFSTLDCPVLAGLSRKGSVYRSLGISAEEALNGTTVVNTIALLRGAHILRVHDVKEAMEAIHLTELYKNEKESVN